MIQFTDYKKFYTSGDEYTYGGNEYIGLVEVVSGKPFSYSASNELTPIQSFSTDIHLSSITFDRLVNDALELPYSFKDIEIGANDYFTYNLFLDRLKKLHTNNTYVFSRMFMPNNSIPSSNFISYFAVSGSSTEAILMSSGYTETTTFTATDNFKDLGYIKQFVAKKNQSQPNNTVIFGITEQNKFIALSATSNKQNLSGGELGYIEVSNKFETEENELIFSQLEDICINNTHLFISDSINNNIIKYNVETFFNGDVALQNRRNLIEVLGNEGDLTDPSRFNKPTLLTCNNEYLAVYDSGNSTIKIFDTFFNYKLKLSGIACKVETIQSIEFDNLENRLYVLTTLGNNIFLYIFDDRFRLMGKYTLEETLFAGEVINGISFAKANNNYWYIDTNLNVYQKLKNRPEKKLGRFQATRLQTSSLVIDPAIQNIWNLTSIKFNEANFIWNAYNEGSTTQVSNLFVDYIRGIQVLDIGTDEDEVIFLTRGKLYIFNEPYVLKQVTKNKTYNNFGLNNISLSPEEYIQTFVINKELYKLISDIFVIKNNIVGRFTGEYDEAQSFVLRDYNYNIDFSSYVIKDSEQYYIHENEKNSTGVINRVLQNIYNLQMGLIELTKVDKGEELPTKFGVPILS